MINLYTYITEAIKGLSKNTKGIIVFDIDDTLLRVDSNGMSVWKSVNGDKNNEIKLTTSQFAKDPDAIDHPEWFDHREFRNPKKIRDSIINGTPILKNLKLMDAHIRAGYDFCFLTARACEDVIADALQDFLMTRDKNGVLRTLGDEFKRTMSHAINDEFKQYPGNTDAQKKANVLKDISSKYNKVVFVDDDEKNIIAAKNLGLKNLTVIKSWE